LNKRSILLIGMPAVGKSTYGKYLAKQLGLKYIDTDDLIEELSGSACADILNEQGVKVFAEYESQALGSVMDTEGIVIATGGSAIYREEIKALADQCLTVHLFSRKNTLSRRIGNAKDRGIVFPEGMDFEGLYKQRMPLYKDIAELEFSTDSKRGNQYQLSKQLLKVVNQHIDQYEEDQKWMAQALELAKKAQLNGEVPIGALVVSEGRVLSGAGNQTIADCDATAHAEVVAIRQACEGVQNHRLINATLYVTLEPCSMCAGAIIQSRIKRVVFAAKDERAGAVVSRFSLLSDDQLNHRCELTQ